nr:NTP transferase domain-containing protein [Bdellovibrio sp. HM001]
MQDVTSVVVSCAGMGTRLGMGIPKSLIQIAGRPLIHWQLELLKDVEDVRVVVGYRAEDVISAVREVRSDVMFVLNNQYSSTQTGYSFALGARYSKEYVLSLDGDLLVHPEDWNRVLSQPGELVGVCPPSTEQPVCVELDISGRVVGFTREKTSHEWTGLLKIKGSRVKLRNSYVYELVQDYLPFSKIDVRCCEIDTPGDYDKAEDWVAKYLVS